MKKNNVDPSYNKLIRQAVSAVTVRDVPKADALIREALAMDYSRPENFNILGIIMELGHEREQAQVFYRAALALDPTYQPARNNLDRTMGFRRSGTWDLGIKP